MGRLSSTLLVVAVTAGLALVLLPRGEARAALIAVDTTEVRVAAQRLDDGRTEFALQERLADGSWAARLLPQRRFVPASPRVGRWLTSSVVTMSARGDGAGAAELRIAAQLLDDGRMEFALQERGAGGGWGDRVLAQRRFFPADPATRRWLVTSPIGVSLLESQPGVLVWEGPFVSVSVGSAVASQEVV